MRLPVDVPVELGRHAARDLAERELADPAYQAAQPSLAARILAWVLERLTELLGLAAGAAPGGPIGLVLLLALVVAAGLLIRSRLGPLARRDALPSESAVFAGRVRTAAEHRAAADAAEAAGDWPTAVLERFRGIVRDLEERGLLDRGDGRTADEVAAQAGARLPDHAAALTRAAENFDAVRYGGRPVSAAEAERLRRLERSLHEARRAGRAARAALPSVPR